MKIAEELGDEYESKVRGMDGEGRRRVHTFDSSGVCTVVRG